ncbi:MAG: c-type cytochrome [Candidatus Methylomirabilota bacterium]
MITLSRVTWLAAIALVLPAFPVLLAQGTGADGGRIFRTRCAACHSTEAGQNRVGPHLAGIVGRVAGTAEGYRYSRPLQASRIVWNEQTLDAYLKSPQDTVQGTSMVISLPDADQRAAVIDYLKTLTAGNEVARGISAKIQPTATCNTCQQFNAADDRVFTQYYPVRRAVKGR